MAVTRKPTQTPKPKVTPKVTPKPKATPIPKFTMPTVAQYRKSAAYRSDDGQTYKEYVFTAKEIYDAKYGKKK